MGPGPSPAGDVGSTYVKADGKWYDTGVVPPSPLNDGLLSLVRRNLASGDWKVTVIA